jgi:hypothetical protein
MWNIFRYKISEMSKLGGVHYSNQITQILAYNIEYNTVSVIQKSNLIQ